jgi:hypothetical protein
MACFGVKIRRFDDLACNDHLLIAITKLLMLMNTFLIAITKPLMPMNGLLIAISKLLMLINKLLMVMDNLLIAMVKFLMLRSNLLMLADKPQIPAMAFDLSTKPYLLFDF